MLPEQTNHARECASAADIQLAPASPVPQPRNGRIRPCRVCLGDHNDETHEATVSVHGWFREQVTRYLD